jgi:hypothetical protein
MAIRLEPPPLDLDRARKEREQEQEQPPPNSASKPNGPAPVYQLSRLRDLKPNLTCNDLIKGMLPARGVGEVHADSSGGKTAIVVDMMLHVGEGREYRDRRTIKTPVVYVALEGHAGIENRVLAAAKESASTSRKPSSTCSRPVTTSATRTLRPSSAPPWR